MGVDCGRTRQRNSPRPSPRAQGRATLATFLPPVPGSGPSSWVPKQTKGALVEEGRSGNVTRSVTRLRSVSCTNATRVNERC